MQPKKQLKVQYIGIFEEIDSFYWPKMHFLKKGQKIRAWVDPPLIRAMPERKGFIFHWGLPLTLIYPSSAKPELCETRPGSAIFPQSGPKMVTQSNFSGWSGRRSGRKSGAWGVPPPRHRQNSSHWSRQRPRKLCLTWKQKWTKIFDQTSLETWTEVKDQDW